MMDIKYDLDILAYWKGNQYKYPQLAAMVRDILSVPIITMSSKSVFSVGSRVLDQYHSSLNPTTAEAIIFTRDWIFNKNGFNEEEATKDLVGEILNLNIDECLPLSQGSSVASALAQ